MDSPKNTFEEGPRSPHRDDEWEALVQHIAVAAGPELARRRQELTLTYVFAEWSRPVMAAAAVLAFAFGSVLALSERREVSADVAALTLAEVVTPAPLALWMDPANQPTLIEVVHVLEGGRK